jgi:CRP-like cAMP-binding protein
MTKETTQRLLSKAACLARLPQGTCARLAFATELVRLKKGQTILHAGDRPDGFYVLAAGCVNLVAHMPGGAHKVLDILLPGQSFGEAFMFLGRSYGYDALAATDATLLRVGQRAVLSEIDTNPRFARHMLAALSEQLLDGIRETQSHALSATQRFAQLMLRYAHEKPQHGTLRLKFPVRKTEIASRIDLTPEHLSRLLRSLSNRGLIRVTGSEVLIVDAAAVRAIARGKAVRDESANPQRAYTL